MSSALSSSIGQKIVSDVQKKFQTRSINISIQINLPVTEDPKVYETIFKVIRENFLETEQRETAKSAKQTK